MACSARWRSNSSSITSGGLAKNENRSHGAFVIDELTELVEEAVLREFEAVAERGGVLGAMETGYRRGKIRPVPTQHVANGQTWPTPKSIIT